MFFFSICSQISPLSRWLDFKFWASWLILPGSLGILSTLQEKMGCYIVSKIQAQSRQSWQIMAAGGDLCWYLAEIWAALPLCSLCYEAGCILFDNVPNLDCNTTHIGILYYSQLLYLPAVTLLLIHLCTVSLTSPLKSFFTKPQAGSGLHLKLYEWLWDIQQLMYGLCRNFTHSLLPISIIRGITQYASSLSHQMVQA